MVGWARAEEEAEEARLPWKSHGHRLRDGHGLPTFLPCKQMEDTHDVQRDQQQVEQRLQRVEQAQLATNLVQRGRQADACPIPRERPTNLVPFGPSLAHAAMLEHPSLWGARSPLQKDLGAKKAYKKTRPRRCSPGLSFIIQTSPLLQPPTISSRIPSFRSAGPLPLLPLFTSQPLCSSLSACSLFRASA